MIKVTSIRLKKINSDRIAKAIASVVIDDCICIHDIRVIEGKNGTFIGMPSRKTTEGTFKDIVHPINSETRKIIEDAVLEEYNK